MFFKLASVFAAAILSAVESVVSTVLVESLVLKEEDDPVVFCVFT